MGKLEVKAQLTQQSKCNVIWALKARRGKGGSTTSVLDWELCKPEMTGSFVLRWTSKLGRCLHDSPRGVA